MLFPCLQKQRRLLEPPDQTQELNHMGETDFEMWNCPSLNRRLVVYSRLPKYQIEFYVTFTNIFGITLQK